MEVSQRQQRRTEVDRVFRLLDGEAVHSASLYTDNTRVFTHADTHTHAATAPHQVTHSVSPPSFPLTYIFVFYLPLLFQLLTPVHSHQTHQSV